MVHYPLSKVVDLDKRIVRAEFPTAKVKSTGYFYLIKCDDGTVLGNQSPTPEWAWYTARKHVACM